MRTNRRRKRRTHPAALVFSRVRDWFVACTRDLLGAFGCIRARRSTATTIARRSPLPAQVRPLTRASRSRRSAPTRRRRGFVLPLVIVSMLLVAILSAATQTQAWRADRSARGAFNGTRALLAADEALARTIATWNVDSFANIGIGGRRQTSLRTAAGDEAQVTVTRPAPLVAWLDAKATSNSPGARGSATRGAARALFIAPALGPFNAALTVLTPVELTAGAQVSGIDVSRSSDDCGPWRDTASIAGLLARVANVAPDAVIVGAPPRQVLVDQAPLQSDFDRAWPDLVARAEPRAPPDTLARVALPSEWRAIAWSRTTPVLIAGDLAYRGTLAVNGELIVRGRLRVHGLLVVRGVIDARDGALEVDGALLVAAPDGRASSFGRQTIVRYSQCIAQRALATIGRPTTAPFRVWVDR